MNSRVHAIGLKAEVEITYEYINHLSHSIDGIFVFPIESFDMESFLSFINNLIDYWTSNNSWR